MVFNLISNDLQSISMGWTYIKDSLQKNLQDNASINGRGKKKDHRLPNKNMESWNETEEIRNCNQNTVKGVKFAKNKKMISAGWLEFLVK